MSSLRSLWLRWKMLRLPWRRKFLIGQDLQGNTFWEFRDTSDPRRLRRIVHPRAGSRLKNMGDVHVTPAWHQWLRQTRFEAPSVEEQAADVQRMQQLKINAQLADQRWNEKRRYIEGRSQAVEREADGSTVSANANVNVNTAQDNWQPEGWTPTKKL